MGWPSTVVDVLEERLDLLGWRGDDTGHLQALMDDGLGLEVSLAHLDALIYGISFVAVNPNAALARELGMAESRAAAAEAQLKEQQRQERQPGSERAQPPP